MNKNYQNQKRANLFSIVFRSLLIAPVMFTSSIALAMPQMKTEQLTQVNPDGTNQAPSNPTGTSSPLNPRPSIFNEPPYNRSRNTLPSDSNAAPTTQPPDPGVAPTTPDAERSPNIPTTTEPGSVQPPLPESQQAPSALVTPVDGKLNIKLINATNAVVNYQVVGDTNQRTLTGDTDVTLQNIATPVTVTFERQDRGLLKVTPTATSAGLLEVILDETTSLDQGKGTIRVEKGGAVFVN